MRRLSSLDVTRDDEAARVVEEVIATWGRIDVLVNNAGVITYDTPLRVTTMDQWDEVMNTNLRGMHLVSRAVIPHMMLREHGVIINIGSSSGRRPDSEYGAYATSKWGVVGYTISLADSLRPLRNQSEWHQSRLGGYRYGTGLTIPREILTGLFLRMWPKPRCTWRHGRPAL